MFGFDKFFGFCDKIIEMSESAKGAEISVGRGERELLGKKVFLEIGTSERPFPMTGVRKIRDDELFVGIDWGRREASLAGSKLNALNRKTGLQNCFELQADGNTIPLRDRSVKEVVMINVFSLLSHLKAEHGHKFQDIVTREISRVLEDGGVLTIIETLTPDPAKLGLEDIEESGYTEVFPPGSNRRVRKKYREISEKDSPESFIVQYRKIGNNPI
jgi:ubiquinone/menaquinone biosynthesis C-methylase UbiE